MSLLSFQGINFDTLVKIWPNLKVIDKNIAKQIEIEGKYLVYLNRQKKDINSYKKDNNLKIPVNFNYKNIGSLSNEAREILISVQPETIAQASALPGITPAAINAVLIHMRRKVA